MFNVQNLTAWCELILWDPKVNHHNHKMMVQDLNSPGIGYCVTMSCALSNINTCMSFGPPALQGGVMVDCKHYLSISWSGHVQCTATNLSLNLLLCNTVSCSCQVAPKLTKLSNFLGTFLRKWFLVYSLSEFSLHFWHCCEGLMETGQSRDDTTGSVIRQNRARVVLFTV